MVYQTKLWLTTRNHYITIPKKRSLTIQSESKPNKHARRTETPDLDYHESSDEELDEDWELDLDDIDITKVVKKAEDKKGKQKERKEQKPNAWLQNYEKQCAVRSS